jgi:membrane associated rhomboid family serine protease
MVGGVAFWAHIGGFVAGYLLARLARFRVKAYDAPSW